jgi:O-antigen/teichoic acid export membrane protein
MSGTATARPDAGQATGQATERATGRTRLIRALHSSGLVIAARFGGVGAGLAVQLALARLLSAADLGLFFMATGMAMVLATIAALGYPMMLPRFVAEAAAEATPALLARFLRHARRDVLGLSLVFAAAAATVIWMLPDLSAHERLGLMAAAATIPGLAVLRINGALANALRRFSLGYVPDLLARPVMLVAFIALLWAAGQPFGLTTVLIAQAAIALGLAAWQRMRIDGADTLQTDLAASATEGPPAGGALPAADWRRQALHILPAMVFLAVFADVAILAAGTMMEKADTGVFGVALKMSMIAAFAIHTVQQIAVRDLADDLHSGDTGALAGAIARTNMISLAVSVAALAGAVVLGRPVLALFGEPFVAGYWPLVILMVAQVVRAASGPTMQMIALSGEQRACVPVFAASFLVLLVANAILIPALELIGAALAVLLSTTAWSVWLAVHLRRKAGIWTPLALPRREVAL